MNVTAHREGTGLTYGRMGLGRLAGGVAALMVVVAHRAPVVKWDNAWTAFVFPSMVIFFVISGLSLHATPWEWRCRPRPPTALGGCCAFTRPTRLLWVCMWH